MKKLAIKVLLILSISTLLTFGLSKYIPNPAFEMQKANAAFSSLRVMIGASGVVTGDLTSYAFDGTGDSLTAADSSDWDFAASNSDNWTIDLWFRTDNTALTQYLVQHATDSINTWDLRYIASGGFRFDLVVAGSQTILLTQAGPLSDADFHHIALIKIADEYGAYLDGAQVNYVQDSSIGNFAGTLYIGTEVGVSAFLNGNLDEVRIIKSNPFSGAPNVGTTDTITVPTSEHASDANTKLLIHSGETKTGTTGSQATFTDSGNTGHTITEVGDAIEDTVTFKF